MKNRKWWDIKASTNAQGAAVVEIRIYDEIGFWGTNAKTFVAQLDEAAANAAELVIAVNSPGGDVFDAFAIYNALRRYAGKVTARVDGVAASAASLIVMAGDQIVMPENAMLMIHNPWMMAVGTATDLRATADMMDRARDGILAAYRTKSGQSDEEIVAMMDAETWLTALEAQAVGLCDVIEEPVKLHASTKAAELLARFKNPPEPVKALVAAMDDPPPLNDPPTRNDLPPSDDPPLVVVPPGPQNNAGELATLVFNACREANLSHLSESIVTASALRDRATVDAAIQNARDIAGVCLAARLPERAEGFVRDGLSVDHVRARLFETLTARQASVNNRKPPALSNPQSAVEGPKAASVYAARKGGAK